MAKEIPKAKYHVGQFIVHRHQNFPGETDLGIISLKEEIKGKYVYSGSLLKIRKTKDERIPYIPTFHCGFKDVPEDRLSSIENLLD